MTHPEDPTQIATPNEAGETARRRMYLAISGLPILFCMGLTVRYGYDVPYWDQWWDLPLMVKAFDGTLGPGDFWASINEHRVFFATFLKVALGRLTHWTLGYELAASIVFMVLVFMTILFQAKRLADSVGLHGTFWFAPVLSLYLFSYSMHNLWMWGLHVMIAMAAFFLVCALAFLNRDDASWTGLGLAALFGVLASYTFGAGVVIWPVGACLLMLRGRLPIRARSIRLGVWIVLAATTMAVYFVGYEATPANQTAATALTRPVGYLAYVLAYLGSPLFSFHAGLSIAAGTLGVGAMGWMAWRIVRSDRKAADELGFVWGLLLVGLCAGLLTGLKQYHEGPQQALSSRYIVWPTLFWCGVLTLMHARRVSERSVGRALIALFVLLGLANTAYGAYRADERHDAFSIGRRALIEGGATEDLRFLYPDPALPLAQRAILEEYRLTAFRESEFRR